MELQKLIPCLFLIFYFLRLRCRSESENPQALLQQMLAQKNPQLQQALDYVQKNGGDPKAAFEKLAAEKGIDPAEVEQMFK